MRIRRGRATVTRERHPHDASRPLGRPGKAAGAASVPGSQETCLQPATPKTPSARRGASVAHHPPGLPGRRLRGRPGDRPRRPRRSTPSSASRGPPPTSSPESAIPIEGAGTATVFDSQFAPVDVSRAIRVLAALPRDLGHRARPRLHVLPRLQRGAGREDRRRRRTPARPAGSTGSTTSRPPSARAPLALKQGDSVLWYYGAADGARELDVTPSSDRVSTGASFTVDGDELRRRRRRGSRAPARRCATARPPRRPTAPGRATFVAQGAGTQTVSATRAGDIRSAARSVCSFGARPDGLQPARPAAAPRASRRPRTTTSPPAAASSSRASEAPTAPCAAIRGVAGPDRSDVAGVEVALAKRVGTLCRFRARSGGLTTPRACTARLYVRSPQRRRQLDPAGRQGPVARHLEGLEPRDRRSRQPRGRRPRARQHRDVPRRAPPADEAPGAHRARAGHPRRRRPPRGGGEHRRGRPRRARRPGCPPTRAGPRPASRPTPSWPSAPPAGRRPRCAAACDALARVAPAYAVHGGRGRQGGHGRRGRAPRSGPARRGQLSEAHHRAATRADATEPPPTTRRSRCWRCGPRAAPHPAPPSGRRSRHAAAGAGTSRSRAAATRSTPPRS